MRDATGNRYTYDLTYSTSEEIAFINGLATGAARTSRVATANGWASRGANPEAFLNYARLVMTGMRNYDPGVDVAVVRRHIAELMPAVGKAA